MNEINGRLTSLYSNLSSLANYMGKMIPYGTKLEFSNLNFKRAKTDIQALSSNQLFLSKLHEALQPNVDDVHEGARASLLEFQQAPLRKLFLCLDNLLRLEAVANDPLVIDSQERPLFIKRVKECEHDLGLIFDKINEPHLEKHLATYLAHPTVTTIARSWVEGRNVSATVPPVEAA